MAKRLFLRQKKTKLLHDSILQKPPNRNFILAHSLTKKVPHKLSKPQKIAIFGMYKFIRQATQNSLTDFSQK